MLDNLRALYQQVILDHSRQPRNFRTLPQPTCHADGHNPMCGDAIAVSLKISDGGEIIEAAFTGNGCAISLASASLMTEVLIGRTVADAERLIERFRAFCHPGPDQAEPPDAMPEPWDRLQVFAGVRAYPSRIKCATLPWVTLRAALAGEEEATSE